MHPLRLLHGPWLNNQHDCRRACHPNNLVQVHVEVRVLVVAKAEAALRSATG